jgi:penicillin-binding protein 2B
MKKEKNELKNIRFSRLYVFIGLFIFGLIIYRVYILSTSELVEGVNLQKLANNRITRQETLYSKRGTIYDVNGDPLAQNVASYTLIAYLSPKRTGSSKTPKHVIDKEHTAEELSKVLDIPKDQILTYLSKDAYQVEFGPKAKHLTELKKDEIVALQLPGIDFIETQQRTYPYGRFASYVVGYARKKEVTTDEGETKEDIVGEMGIESYYNDELTGTNGYTLYQKDRNGYKIPGTKEVVVDAIDGHDIYLTIDSNIQLFVEDAIENLTKKCDTEFVSVVLADAKTGAILASGTNPSFDPNIKDITSYLNLNVSTFEPGSTMKIFSYMAAMEYGVYKGNEKYKSGYFTAKDGTKISDWRKQGWGEITYDAGFALSSNTAVMNLVSKYMSASKLKAFYNKLGFGSKTGIELPNESSGKIAFKYETEVLNAAFGQGITTTPMQNVKALTSISNNGVLLKPYIIDKIVDHDTGEVLYKGEKTELERVASTKTVKKIKELMRSVITGDSSTSTGYYYNMPGYDFIAKTGTAQVPKENGRGYSDTLVIRGLAGMFPGDDPQVILYMAIKCETCASTYVSKFVQSIVKNTSKYLEIYDETKAQTKKLEDYTLDSYINKNVSSVTSVLKSNQVNYVVLGDGDTIIKQSPAKGEKVNKIDRVFLLTNSNTIKMPNIIGYSSKDFYSLVNMLKIPYTIDGFGYVTEQSIEKGKVLDDKSVLDVKMEAKY